VPFVLGVDSAVVLSVFESADSAALFAGVLFL
jgi:hypothetical protein